MLTRLEDNSFWRAGHILTPLNELRRGWVRCLTDFSYIEEGGSFPSYHDHFATVASPFFTAWTIRLICPNVGVSLRYKSIRSGGRIALDGSSGWLTSSSKLLAAIETYESSREMDKLRVFLTVDSPSTYAGTCQQAGRWFPPCSFGVRRRWAGVLHPRCWLWARTSQMGDRLRSSKRVGVSASYGYDRYDDGEGRTAEKSTLRAPTGRWVVVVPSLSSEPYPVKINDEFTTAVLTLVLWERGWEWENGSLHRVKWAT